MHSRDYHSDDSCQGQFSNPPIHVQEHRRAPLLTWSGVVIVRQLIERLRIAPAIDAAVRLLKRCKVYTESDYVLTLIYNLLTGGETLHDINRLREDPALRRTLGTERIPHATTVGAFLARFDKVALSELREVTEEVQQDAFAMLPRERRAVATLDWDSSNHEVYCCIPRRFADGFPDYF